MSTNPFKGRPIAPPARMRVIHRFEKPNGHWAEICERKITQLRAIEFLVLIDGSLLESQLFHGGREAEYPAALEARIEQFLTGGWQPVPVPMSLQSSPF